MINSAIIMPESIDEEVAENVVEAALLELSTVLPRKDFDVKKKAGEACPIITVDNSSIHDQLVDGNHTHKTCDTTIQFEENTYGSLEREQNSHGETSNWENIRSFFCGNELPRNVAAFFFLGLFNNITYVVNNAGAGDIVPGDYGLIYITSILPTLLIKLTGPYWFHYVPYNVRIIVSALCISLNFILVSYGKYTWLRLVGVALGSIQGGLGESTLLGSAALYTDPAVRIIESNKMVHVMWKSPLCFFFFYNINTFCINSFLFLILSSTHILYIFPYIIAVPRDVVVWYWLCWSWWIYPHSLRHGLCSYLG